MSTQSHKSESGQALVEFALIAIFLLTLTFLLIEIGRIAFAWGVVQHAAREGARYAITGQYDLDAPAGLDARVFSIRQRVISSTVGLPIDSTTDNSIEWGMSIDIWGCCDENGQMQYDFAGYGRQPVQVEVTYRLPMITPLTRPLQNSVLLRGTVVLNNEPFDQAVGSTLFGSVSRPPLPFPYAILEIEKTANPNPVLVNEALVYTIFMRNVGPIESNNVFMEDILPEEVIFEGYSTSQGSCDAPPTGQPGGALLCNLGTLAGGGGSATVTVNVRPTEVGAVFNEAEVTGSNMSPGSPGYARDSVEVTVLEEPFSWLIIDKSASAVQVVQGETFVYTIQVANSNSAMVAAENVVMTDPLPADIAFEAISHPDICSHSGGLVECNLGALDVGQVVAIDITVRAGESALGERTNTATVTADNDPESPRANSATITIVEQPPPPEITISKTDSPDPVVVGEELTYQIIVTNNGPGDANDLFLSDPLPGTVNIVNYTSSAGFSCSLSGNLITCSRAVLPEGSSATLTVIVEPLQVGTLSNTAEATSERTDWVSATAVTDVVEPSTNLAISKNTEPPNITSVVQGTALTFRLVATNQGPGSASGVVVTDTLPLGFNFASAPSGCTHSGESAGGEVVCNIGGMANQASVTIDINVVAVTTGQWVNTAEIGSDDPDSGASDTHTVTVTQGSHFITLTPACGDPGSTITVNGYNWQTGGPWSNIAIRRNGVAWGAQVPKAANWTAQRTIPSNLPHGVYQITAFQDGPGPNFRESPPVELRVPCPKPNLTISDLELVSTMPLTTYEPVVFRAVIENDGEVDAISQFPVGLYFNPDPAPASDDTHISSDFRVAVVNISGLAVGASRVVTLTASAGFGDVGDNDVYAVVDSDPAPTGVIDELDETDNIAGPLAVFVEHEGTPPDDPPPYEGPTGSLFGVTTIESQSGNRVPVSQATVRIFDAEGAEVVEAESSNADGEYYFAEAPEGVFTVTGCVIVDDVEHFLAVTGVVINEGEMTIRNLDLEVGACYYP